MNAETRDRCRSLRQSWGAALLVGIAAAILGGCANFSADGGLTPVQEFATGALRKDIVKVRSAEQASDVDGRVRGLLGQPLSADRAVQIALLNNRGLQAAFNELGVSEAQMIEASLPPSPTLSLARMVVPGAVLEIERQVLQNILGLLTLPRRREIAEDRFRQAQLRAMEAVLRTAGDTRRTYFRAVAAGQNVIFLKRAQLAAESLSDLAKKLGETGSMGKLSQAREHAFYADVSRQLAVMQLTHRGERDRLGRLMGLWRPDQAFKLPDQLPAFPKRARQRETVERDAVARRVDLQIARIELELLAKSYGLTRATRLINVLELRGMSTTEWTTEAGVTEKERWRGVEVEFQIPIYDFGEARTRGASEAYMAAVNRLADKAITVRGEALQAYQAYRGAHDIARIYRDKLRPLREVISQEMLLQYNGMLADLFELLQDARARIQGNVETINAERDFWLASVGLEAAVLGGGGAAASVGGETTAQASDAGGGGH